MVYEEHEGCYLASLSMIVSTDQVVLASDGMAVALRAVFG